MKRFLEFMSLMLVSFGGVGFLPKIPGTFGSIAALVILFVPDSMPFYFFPALIVFVYIISLPAIKVTEKEYGKDASVIVIDEVIAVWIILLVPIIKNDPLYIGVAVTLFRVFDIWKPHLIKKVNEKEGAFFVIFDDVLAAGLTIIVMILIIIAKDLFMITPA